MKILMLLDGATDAKPATSAMASASLAMEGAGLSAAIEPVAWGDAFVEALGSFAPDLVIVQHASKELDFGGVVRAVRETKPGTPVIVVSENMSERDLVHCLKTGVEDVILEADIAQLPAAIQSAVASRRGLERLSPRQLQVLRLIAEGDTNREIARRFRVSIKTVETHRTAVMNRLGLHDLAALVRFAVRAGLVPFAGE